MADDGGFTRVDAGSDGFTRLEAPRPSVDTGGFQRIQEAPTPAMEKFQAATAPAEPSFWDSLKERGRQLRYTITDIPGEMGRTAKENAIGINERLNPFSEAHGRGRMSDNWTGPGTFLGFGKGLLDTAMFVPSVLAAPATSVIGHGWSAVTGAPYQQEPGAPEHPFGTGRETGQVAAMGIGVKGPGGTSGVGPAAMAPIGPPPAAPFAPGQTPLQQFAPVQAGPNPSVAASWPRRAAQTVEKIVSPETVDADAGQAVALIRSATGEAARSTAQTGAALEPYHRRVNALDPQQQLDFIDYVENRSAGAPPPAQDLVPVADALRDAFGHRRTELDNLPQHQGMAFVDDYFPHFWKDPNAAAAFVDSWYGGKAKQGSGASLKARTVPTIADGIAAGLEPITTNPIEATLRYINSMDMYIASTKVRNSAENLGLIKYGTPEVMGASGHPDSFSVAGVPEGWVPLQGRGARNAAGGVAYAPPGFARVYNNFISRGVAEFGQEFGDAMHAARRVSNSVTALELGLSGYHALTMAQESMVNSLANALSKLRSGNVGGSLRSVAETPVAPFTYARKGSKLQEAYLDPTSQRVTPEMRDIAKLLEEGGGRASGVRHAPDYEFSGQGSYVTAWKRGALKAQLIGDWKDVTGRPINGTLAAFGRHMGRILDTVAQPIFEKYIPLIKNGAFYDNMRAWLEQNPGATREQQVRASRQILDSVDNRFGEMVSDNVFWNRALKEAAMLMLRSWSWTIGGAVREIGGGVRDIVRAPFKQRNPNEIGPNDKRWTQKMDYVIALPLVFAGLSAVIQGLMTGEAPRDTRDLLAPRTGGTDANSGEPERMLVPGYMKDVFGFTHDPWQEVKNKIATAPTKALELLNNKNWRGDPIRSPRDPNLNSGEQVPVWFKDYLKYAGESFGSITVRNIVKGQKEGSAIPTWAAALGVRTAPRHLIDPEGYDKMMETVGRRAWQNKLRFEAREKQRYGGTE